MTKIFNYLFVCVVIGIIFSLKIIAGPTWAQPDKNSDAGYIFYKGNTLYEKGSYDEAISEYSKLLAQGIESGNLYYNLGNCYFKKGELGKAVLNYERAKRLIPRDSDLKSNYKYALSQINVTGSKPGSWSDKAFGIFKLLTLNELTLLLSAIFVIIILFLIARLFIPMRKKTFSLSVSCLIIIFAFTAVSLINRVKMINSEAVIVSDSPEAKFEPIEGATTHFTLHEGMKIHVIQSKKEWVKIKRADGKTGWIQKRTIENI